MNEDPAMILSVGDLLVLSHGSYSDKVTNDPVRVLKRVRKGDLIEAYLAAWRLDNDESGPLAHDFLAWLVKAGFVEWVPQVVTWHLGDYELDPEWRTNIYTEGKR